MNRERFLPTVLLNGREGAWEVLRSIIIGELLPRLDRVGVPLFHPPLQPAPPDAHMVPFQDIWVRSRPYPERFPQLAYVISGQGEMILGRFWLSLPSGQGVFVPSGIPHAPHASRGERILPSDWLRVLIYPFGVIVHRCRITPSAHEKSLRYFVANPILSDLFQAWEQGLQGSGNPFRQKSLLCAFFCLLAESSPVPVNPMDWLPPDLESFPFPVQRAILLLHSGFHQPFRLPALAKQCFVSPSHLCHLFRQHLGTTPLGYLTCLRLTIARHLLEQAGLRVGDVAALVGYADWRHFHRLFVRHFGVSPSALLKNREKLPRRFFKSPF
ncbi:MAG: hypothetical protein IMHGJWDQ_001650 [Candidatus Fervidibacter sp.]